MLDVADGSPAAHAGVLVGDEEVGVGGEEVHGPHDLVATLAEAAGQARTLRLVRGGEPLSLDVEVGSR